MIVWIMIGIDLSERRPFSMTYKVVDGVNHTATTYKICADMLPGHLEGYNGTFCLYPPIPRDAEGNPVLSDMNFHCGFDLAVMFERFGFAAGFALGSLFILLWIVLTRKNIEKNSVKWVGRVFGGIHTVWTILSVAAGFYLMIRDAHRVQQSNEYCETFRQTYCNPVGFGEPIVGCTCNNLNYVGMPLLEAILIVIYTFSVISTIFRWFADYRAAKEGYTDLDAAVADLTRNQ